MPLPYYGVYGLQVRSLVSCGCGGYGYGWLLLVVDVRTANKKGVCNAYSQGPVRVLRDRVREDVRCGVRVPRCLLDNPGRVLRHRDVAPASWQQEEGVSLQSCGFGLISTPRELYPNPHCHSLLQMEGKHIAYSQSDGSVRCGGRYAPVGCFRWHSGCCHAGRNDRDRCW